MSFASLELSAQIMHALELEGYATPTPIQAQAIPHVMAGKDLLGVAQTGTGKTAAFALPIIHRLTHEKPEQASEQGGQESPHHPQKKVSARTSKIRATARKTRALVLAPTRELAVQIAQSFKTYGQKTALRQAVIYGGVGIHGQIETLQHGVDIIIATPGRLIDLMEQGYVDLRHVRTLVLDEADNMLDMGFIQPIRRIVSHLPGSTTRQSLMFSATMPPEIRKLAAEILREPVSVEVTPVASTVEIIDQSVYLVEKGRKAALLAHYLNSRGVTRALVFTRTKHGADRVSRHLNHCGIQAAALHGNKTQGQRQRVMKQFKSQAPPVLVATDIAARGLDIDDVSHVVNYDVPNVPETYVHRIGRTGRAGATGCAVSFCDRDERSFLRDIERLIKRSIPIAEDSPAFVEEHTPAREERPRQEQGHREHRPAQREHKPAHRAHRQDHAEHRPARREHKPAAQVHREHKPAPHSPKPHPQAAAKSAHSSGGPRRDGAAGSPVPCGQAGGRSFRPWDRKPKWHKGGKPARRR